MSSLRSHLRSVAFGICAVVYTNIIHAEPNVIFDAGKKHSQSMETYLRVFKKPSQFVLPDDAASRQRIQQELLDRASQHGGYGGVRVPIRSQTLTPQRVASKDAYFPNLMTPLFVVGADPVSLAWLKQWREALLKVGAVGWVVQAENAEELRAIAEAGAGLRFMAMSGDALTDVFGVNGYPVLISQRAIEQ